MFHSARHKRNLCPKDGTSLETQIFQGPCLCPSACLPKIGTYFVRTCDPIRSALQGTAARRYWSCPGNADLRVRGKNYLVVSEGEMVN